MERYPLQCRFVIFQDEVLCVFMRTDAGIRWNGSARVRDCYAHMGQHGSCYDGMEKRKRATPEQFADLECEMISIGYDLRLC